MTYNLCTLFIKLSILSFYLRFSIDRAFRMAVYAVIFITVGYTIPNAFLFLYICKPIASTGIGQLPAAPASTRTPSSTQPTSSTCRLTS